MATRRSQLEGAGDLSLAVLLKGALVPSLAV